MGNMTVPTLFSEAVQCKNEGLLVDAIRKFREVVEIDPEGHLADDAQVNVALCFFHMKQFSLAKTEFRKVIDDYPNAEIEPSDSSTEFGMTAAKALYGEVSCCIALNQLSDARELLKEMTPYTDSYVLVGKERITFYDLARKAVESAMVR